ncbi:uncharacterized protein BDV14DRAFT_198749 [Aspergillus stella-maris]|uniref:uncharacterized protein n=1 Tax=Aspergillus stella-maris TaxID=1810926 RepID=UPI003CCDC9CC
MALSGSLFLHGVGAPYGTALLQKRLDFDTGESYQFPTSAISVYASPKQWPLRRARAKACGSCGNGEELHPATKYGKWLCGQCRIGSFAESLDLVDPRIASCG